MCGVPAHSSHTYISRLINSGFKVAIAEQIGGLEVNSKKNYQKIFKRDVVRIITPGTILEDNLLEPKSFNNLLSISFLKGEMTLTWIDMTTGLIKLQRIKGKEFKQDLLESIKKVDPCEIICNLNLKESKIFNSILNLLRDKLTDVADSFFDIKNNVSKIRSYFKNSEISSLGDFTQVDISSIGALVNYLELTQKNNIPLIKGIEIVNPSEFMQIDNFSFTSLEVFKKIDGDKAGSLISVVDKTNTSQGGRLLKEFLKFPLININEIKKRHHLVSLFIEEIDILDTVRNFLKEIPDVERAISRITANINNPRDLILVLNFVKNSLKTFSALKNLKIKEFDEICPENNVSNQLADLMGLIEKTINTTPPNVITNGDVINEKVDDDLDRLRNIKSLKQKEIINLQVGYARQTEISNLKVKFNNIHGYFIEVTNKNSQKLLEFSEKKFNLVQNTVNSSRFQTEELNKLTSEIQISESKAIDLEYKIYNDLCEKVRVMANKIGVFSEKIGYIDVISNFSYISKLNNYARPDIEEKIKIIEIEDGRHPIVEESLKHEASNFIPNNCSMSESRNLWLMTGPNMAGKSTFLRQVAITILLNQIGCFVPAKAANLSIFDKIFTRIGASDNLSKGMSTFYDGNGRNIKNY